MWNLKEWTISSQRTAFIGGNKIRRNKQIERREKANREITRRDVAMIVFQEDCNNLINHEYLQWHTLSTAGM